MPVEAKNLAPALDLVDDLCWATADPGPSQQFIEVK
jgi:hypothetical protein